MAYGAWDIKVIKKRFSDYDPNYLEQSEENLKAKPGIIVCNHIGEIDTHLPTYIG